MDVCSLLPKKILSECGGQSFPVQLFLPRARFLCAGRWIVVAEDELDSNLGKGFANDCTALLCIQ